MEFDNIRLLENRVISPGEGWIYVADFNIDHQGNVLKSTDRIDDEVEDLMQIVSAGGNVRILAHKGRFKDGDTEDLEFAVPHLSRRLGIDVKYFPENTTEAAVEFARSLKPGEVAVMGNVRKNKGEEKNDREVARQYAKLGDFVAVGGFGKAHRAEASNNAILEFLPGYLTRSQVAGMELLIPWAGKSEEYSVAVLGGIKKEKITTGLVGFAGTYDCIIPGGIVVNTILKLRYDVGASVLEDSGKTFEKEVREVMEGPNGAKVHVPDLVHIAKFESGRWIGIDGTVHWSDGKCISASKPISLSEYGKVPAGFMIVDYVMPQSGIDALEALRQRGGRMIVAGTPGLHKKGFSSATNAVREYLSLQNVHGVVLGGDTAAEIEFQGPKSKGGGSALHWVAYGTTPVLDALRANYKAFRN